jgi:hypothetical protein
VIVDLAQPSDMLEAAMRNTVSVSSISSRHARSEYNFRRNH